jgi:hypothetical protein
LNFGAWFSRREFSHQPEYDQGQDRHPMVALLDCGSSCRSCQDEIFRIFALKIQPIRTILSITRSLHLSEAILSNLPIKTHNLPCFWGRVYSLLPYTPPKSKHPLFRSVGLPRRSRAKATPFRGRGRGRFPFALSFIHCAKEYFKTFFFSPRSRVNDRSALLPPMIFAVFYFLPGWGPETVDICCPGFGSFFVL